MNQQQLKIIKQINESKLLSYTEKIINRYIEEKKKEINHTTIPLNVFIEKVLRRSKCRFNIVILTNIYFERYINTKDMEIEDERKIFIGVLILAFKYWNDYHHKNKTWVEIIGLEIKEINRIERIILNKINLFVTLEFFIEDIEKYQLLQY